MPVKVNQDLIKKILHKFNLIENQVVIHKLETGYRNHVVPIEIGGKDKQNLALIFYKDEPDILRKIKLANSISARLANLNWPTRHAVAKQGKTILRLQKNNQARYCCLYNYLPGITVNWESYSQKHVKLLGQVLGYLHRDLKTITINQTLSVDNECLVLQSKVDEMSKYFFQDGVRRALEQKLKLQANTSTLESFKELLIWLNTQRALQLLHLDFVRGNILFDKLPSCHFEQNPSLKKFAFDVDLTNKQNKEHLVITGVLDFEKTALGPVELELARTLAFLIIDCKNKSVDKVIKYFLFSGYIKRGQQIILDIKIVKKLTIMFLFFDFYQFLIHNPYEFLVENKHFLRTRDFLQTNTNLLLNLDK